MEYKIQSIVFPTETKHQQCRDLVYHGDSGFLDRENRCLTLGVGQKCDFVTYLNACSYRKWKKYAKVGQATLCLEVSGSVQICYLGYHKDMAMIVRNEFKLTMDTNVGRRTIKFVFPENDEEMIGFEITALEQSVLYGGYFTVEIQEKQINDICLCIATTTCRKEAFIKQNVELLKKEILASSDNIAENLYIHVVDNGETLTTEDINGAHVFLHPNHNTGGSGGFARGMIESLEQNPKATHVLLMDDDVLILPESIKRTYHLLKLLDSKYSTSFISGAMLYYEEPNRQHEDIGTITKNCMFNALKPKYDHNYLGCNIDNEAEFLKQPNEYAGWWYCCIPVTQIEKYGLPLPIFIRCDDMEYSLRCKANIITLNGICLWHMGFVTKYNAAFDKYQQCRNLLIDKACSDILKNVDVFDFVYKSYRIELLKFNYNAAELVLRALEDYLKGPEFLKHDRGESIVKENSKMNDKMIPLEEIPGGNMPNVWDCYFEEPRKIVDKWLFRITFNGQRLCPPFLRRKKLVPIAFDHSYQPQKMTLHNKLLAVNPYNKTGVIRCLDVKKYRKLQKKCRELVLQYKKEHKRIEGLYRKEMKCLTSSKFWKEYLGI